MAVQQLSTVVLVVCDQLRRWSFVSDLHTSEDLERVDLQGLNVGTVSLNDGQLMAIN